MKESKFNPTSRKLMKLEVKSLQQSLSIHYLKLPLVRACNLSKLDVAN